MTEGRVLALYLHLFVSVNIFLSQSLCLPGKLGRPVPLQAILSSVSLLCMAPGEDTRFVSLP